MTTTKNVACRVGARATRYTTLCLFALVAVLCHSHEARAQWTTTGTNTTTTDNVGVGTATPQGQLDVSGAAATVVRSTFGGTTGSNGKFQIFSRDLPNNPFGEMQMFAPGGAGTEYLRFNVGNSGGTVYPDALTINRTGNVGVGTVNPAGKLGLLTTGAVNLLDASVVVDSYTNNASSTGVAGRRARGSLASPAAVQPGDILSNIDGYGYGSTGFSSGARGKFTIRAAETWSDAAQGTYATIETTSLGSAGRLERLRVDPAGKVGIGTTTPLAPLHVSTGGPSGGVAFFQKDSASNGVGIGTTNGVAAISGVNSNYTTTTDLLINPYGGKVGIGTAAPATALHVVGDLTVTGNVNAKWQDMAEWVPTTQKLAVGTVVVVDSEGQNHVLASAKSYDTGVAGVITGQPGLILGEGGEGKVMVATTGRVKVKVDATRAPVRAGDLLVTSDVAGVAMKSVPVELGGVEMHRPGTIIGKALEPLEKGTGEILVLLSLQ